MRLIPPEDVCIRGQPIIQNSKFTRKLSLQPKSFPGLGSCAARGKEIRVFSAFCLRLRAGYVPRVETIRLNSVSDRKKKVASDGVSTISPVIASSRYLFSFAARVQGAISDGSAPSATESATGKRICSPQLCYRCFGRNGFMVFEERSKEEGEAARKRALVARLRQFVEDSDLSFYEIASRVGTSGGILSMWLAGTARPRAAELAAIEKFLQG
jgi:hypothetical protein